MIISEEISFEEARAAITKIGRRCSDASCVDKENELAQPLGIVRSFINEGELEEVLRITHSLAMLSIIVLRRGFFDSLSRMLDVLQIAANKWAAHMEAPIKLVLNEVPKIRNIFGSNAESLLRVDEISTRLEGMLPATPKRERLPTATGEETVLAP